jgi:hypothetical protein
VVRKEVGIEISPRAEDTACEEADEEAGEDKGEEEGEDEEGEGSLTFAAGAGEGTAGGTSLKGKRSRCSVCSSLSLPFPSLLLSSLLFSSQIFS